jgi:segregation and condensation protein A
LTPARASSRLPSQHGFEPFVVELERFQGPLDLLLHLIRAQDIDIFDIPIARITAQFQAVLADGFERVELDRAGEFLELAATLVRIKAQLLLPRPDDADWTEDPRADLVRRLIEYELFQEVAHVLAGAEADRARHFGKGYVAARPRPSDRPPLTTTLEEWLAAAWEVPEPLPELQHVAPIQIVTVEEKMSLIEARLGRKDRLLFSRLFSSWKQRSHVVASLLACLEMAKQQVLRIEQVKRFGSIWLFSRKNSTPEPEETA